MVKQYSQKQMDSAKKRAYNKGYDEAYNLVMMNEVIESASEVQEWQKWEQYDFDWTVVALVVVCAGVILMMIF